MAESCRVCRAAAASGSALERGGKTVLLHDSRVGRMRLLAKNMGLVAAEGPSLRRRLSVAIVGCVAMMGAVLGMPHQAAASQPCGGSGAGSQNLHDGAGTTTNSYYGVWAEIVTKTPALCTGAYGGLGPLSTAW